MLRLRVRLNTVMRKLQHGRSLSEWLDAVFTRHPALGHTAGLAVLTAGLVYVAIKALSEAGVRRFPDAQVYILAAETVLDDSNRLYDVATVHHAPFTYPPFAALVMLPFSFMPITTLGVALGVASLAVWWCTLRACATALRLSPVWLPFLVGFTCFMTPVANTLYFGQIGILLAGLVTLDMTRLSRPWSGTAIGVAAGIKLLPAAFIGHLVLTRQWRTARHAIATLLATVALACIVLPFASARYWLEALWETTRVGLIDGPRNRSLNGLLARQGATPALLTAAACVTVAIGFARSHRAHRQGNHVSALSLIGLTTALVSPVTWSHHLVWVAPACMTFLRCRASLALVPLVWALTVFGPFPWDNLIGRSTRTTLETVTLVGLALLVPTRGSRSDREPQGS